MFLFPIDKKNEERKIAENGFLSKGNDVNKQRPG